MFQKSRKVPIIFFCESIRSDANRAQFNRTRFLCRRYSIHIVGMGPISHTASQGAKSVNEYPSKRKIFRFFYPIWACFKIRSISKKNRIKIVYCTFTPLNIIISSTIKKWLRVKWVADLWDDPEKTYLMRKNFTGFGNSIVLRIKHLEYLVVRKVLRTADRFVIGVLPGPIYKKYGIPKEKSLCITNGINTDYEIPESKGDGNEPFTLFYCGTVDRIRLEGLKRGMEALIDKTETIRLKIIGRELDSASGWLKNEFRSIGNKIMLEIEKRQPYDVVVSAIRAADICICPYPNKLDIGATFPVKIFDYMFMGRPIVASALPGINKILKNGYDALLFPPGDYGAMAQCIIRLYKNPKLRKTLGENAKISVKRFDWKQINENIAHFLRPVTGI